MKAEERKELETNILADKLGRMVKGAKKGPNRRGVLVFIGAILLILVGVVLWRLRSNEGTANSKRWKEFLLNDHRFVKGTTQDNVARMVKGHQNLWQEGVAKLLLPNNFKTAMAAIKDAEGNYMESARLLKDDPLMSGEANFQLGIIQELKSLEDQAATDANLKEAVVYYEKAAAAWKPESPLGKMAKDRSIALQYVVTDHTVAELKKLVDRDKTPVLDIWTEEEKKKHVRDQQVEQDELEAVTKALKPLLNKAYESTDTLRDAVRDALAASNDIEKNNLVRWQSRVVELAVKRRQAAANVYRQVAFWTIHPLPPQFGNPHFGNPQFGMPNFGLPN